MKIISAEQIKQLDTYTIQHEPVASVDLMERASLSFVEWYMHLFKPGEAVMLFCGTGNNGGDGLAIARMLLERKFHVQVFVVYYTENTSPDFDTNYQRLKDLLTIASIRSVRDIPAIGPDSVVIDAIFGSGLNRPVTGIAAEVIDHINNAEVKVIAVDIPSGLYVDTHNDDSHIIQAEYTISFQLPKLSFLLPQNAIFVGEWHLTDIGLHPAAIEKAQTSYYYTDQAVVRKLVKKRNKFSHKGTFGHALLIGGSFGKMGAAVLATRSCLRSGVGLLTVHIPGCGYEIMQISVPEAMTMVDADEKHFTEISDIEKYTAIGIGPGLSTESKTAAGFKKILQQADKPLVIDADGLNLLSSSKELLALLPVGSILTPHPKEFERLAGKSANEYQRLEALKEFSARHQAYVVLKGAHTAIASPSGEVYFNSTGNPGMATGGTGDVLTGIITSLLAQHYHPFEAAILGVYFHGLAGDMAANNKGFSGLIASDLIEYLPAAFLQFGL